MEFIEFEAEVDGQEEVEEEEEQEEEIEEDTGVGTLSQLSQLFDNDTDGELDSPDFAGHRTLLLQQQNEDRESVPVRLECHASSKRPRTPTPRKLHDDKFYNEQLSPGIEAMQIRTARVPSKVRKSLQDLLSDPVSESDSESPSGRDRVKSQVETAIRDSSSTGECSARGDAVREAGDNMRERGPFYAVRSPVPDNDRNSPAGARPQNAHAGLSVPSEPTTQDERQTRGEQLLSRVLTSKNARQTVLAIFKELYTASYTEVTRTYKSDKTQSNEWVFVVLGAAQVFYESLRECLKNVTEFLLFDVTVQQRIGVFYCGFRGGKNREGLRRCLSVYSVNPETIVLSDPPNKRSVVAALFFNQKLFVAHGEHPTWCKDILANGELACEGFELTKMVQWALDNNLHDEGSIAYNYAQLADTDANARLWLKSNSQAKYVRDAAQMVRNYLRGQMHAMDMNEHIASRMRHYSGEDEEEGWKRIVVFLRYQRIDVPEFLRTMSYWLKGRPKKSTIAFCGIPDSGKSMLAMSLISFMDGKVLGFNNSRSHFWLQPLSECKCGLIDDVTKPCWDYIDTYMRNALDGNPICIDCKHRAPLQIKCPPLILTSNYNPLTMQVEGSAELVYKYLISRLHIFPFNRVIPIIGGRPRFLIRGPDWRSFFLKYGNDLGLDLTDLDYGQPTAAEDTGGSAGERG